jgi:hypothetical protein
MRRATNALTGKKPEYQFGTKGYQFHHEAGKHQRMADATFSQAQELRQKGDMAGAVRLEQQARQDQRRAQDYEMLANDPKIRNRKGDGEIAAKKDLTPEERARLHLQKSKRSLENQARGLADVAENGLGRATSALPDIDRRIKERDFILNREQRAQQQEFDVRADALQQKRNGTFKYKKGQPKTTPEELDAQAIQLANDKKQWEADRLNDLRNTKKDLEQYSQIMADEGVRNRLRDDARAAQGLVSDVENDLGAQTHQQDISTLRRDHNKSFNNSEIAGKIIYGENDHVQIHQKGGHDDQQLWLEQSTGQQFVLDQDGQHVPRYLVRNLGALDTGTLKNGGGIIPANPKAGRQPLAHAEGLDTGDNSFTAKSDGEIMNPQSQSFNNYGKVELDAYQLSPKDILDLSTAPNKGAHNFPALGGGERQADQASRDVVRTQEVLVQGEGKDKKIPNDVLTQGKNGKPIIFDVPGTEGTPENQVLIDQLQGHPDSAQRKQQQEY